MSGHSKWATIKRKKGLIDAERGKIFQKLAKEIFVAAKKGDPNPENNASLRAVMDKAKAQNMPKDRVQAAIDKAIGSGSDQNFDAIRYEGYGPGGSAIIVDCLTDNKNRTASMVRSTFTKHNGNLGTDGSVSYLFERKGVLITDKTFDEEELMLTAIDAGALDFITNEDSYEIYTTQDTFSDVKKALEGVGVENFLVCEMSYLPTNTVSLSEETLDKAIRLIDALEELDDVNDIYHNIEM